MTVRHILRLPYATHRYLIETLSGCLHPKTMLASRAVKFKDTLMESNKFAVKLLGHLATRDKSTVIGSNICRIMRELGDTPVSVSNVKKSLKYCVNEEEKWRSSFILDLLKVRDGDKVLTGIDNNEFETLLEFLCCS